VFDYFSSSSYLFDLNSMLWLPGPNLPQRIAFGAYSPTYDGELNTHDYPYFLLSIGTVAITGGYRDDNPVGLEPTQNVYIYGGQIEGWQDLGPILQAYWASHVAIPVLGEDYNCR